MKLTKQETLKGSADLVEKISHFVPFTDDEIAERMANLSHLDIQIADAEADFKIIKDLHKEKVKPIEKKRTVLIDSIRDKGEIINEECYAMFEGEFAIYYDGEGTEVYKRPLLISEKGQRTIQMEVRKEGTNE